MILHPHSFPRFLHHKVRGPITPPPTGQAHKGGGASVAPRSGGLLFGRQRTRGPAVTRATPSPKNTLDGLNLWQEPAEGHRSAAGADFQTARPRTHRKSGEVVTRPRVESRLKPGEPHTLHFPGMVVLVALRHGQRLLSPRPPNEAAEDAAEGSRSAGASPGNGCGLSGARASHHGRPEGDMRFLGISAYARHCPAPGQAYASLPQTSSWLP